MADPTDVWADIPTRRRSDRTDATIAAIAERQHGVVSRAQLLALGIGTGAIKHRVAMGRLQPLHRGVFAVGHRALRPDAYWMAAVLAAGEGAVLSHRSAAALWGMRETSRTRIDVSVPRDRRSTARVEVHVIAMRPDEVTARRGIPVTTPARTLLDLAAVVSEEETEAAFNEAQYRRLGSPTSLDALVARYSRRKGTPAITRILENHRKNGDTVTRSVLERRFLALLDAHDLPRPKINRHTRHGELDARWPDQRLVVECDGFAAHGTRRAFERDRARDRKLIVAGWRVIRLTWRQLTEEGELIARQLAALLGD